MLESIIMTSKSKLSLAKLVAKQKKTRHKRQAIPSRHPTQKMDTDDLMTFHRKMDPDCRLRRKVFTVKKTSEPAGIRKSVNDRFTFYAVYGRFWPNALPNPKGYRRYENQIGFIRCGPGWIELLTVFRDARLRINNTLRIVNAQKSGVGVVLVELCLLDPYIFEQDEHNQAKQNLDEAGLTIHGGCNRLVGLEMASSSPGGGHVYFSAGIRMGYRKILISQSCWPGAIGVAEDFQFSYHTYNTQVARDNYVSLLGEIRACAGYVSCQAWQRNWYLCDGHDIDSD